MMPSMRLCDPAARRLVVEEHHLVVFEHGYIVGFGYLPSMPVGSSASAEQGRLWYDQRDIQAL